MWVTHALHSMPKLSRHTLDLENHDVILIAYLPKMFQRVSIERWRWSTCDPGAGTSFTVSRRALTRPLYGAI